MDNGHPYPPIGTPFDTPITIYLICPWTIGGQPTSTGRVWTHLLWRFTCFLVASCSPRSFKAQEIDQGILICVLGKWTSHNHTAVRSGPSDQNAYVFPQHPGSKCPFLWQKSILREWNEVWELRPKAQQTHFDVDNPTNSDISTNWMYGILWDTCLYWGCWKGGQSKHTYIDEVSGDASIRANSHDMPSPPSIRQSPRPCPTWLMSTELHLTQSQHR